MRQKTSYASYRFFVLFFYMAGIFLLAGCAAPILGNNANQQPLSQDSYNAADMLIQQSRNVITAETPLQIGVLNDIRTPNETTALGRLITDQIGARFVQLGYNVTAIGPVQDVMAMPQNTTQDVYTAQNYGSSAMTAPSEKAVITGHYAFARKNILVNLRILESTSNRVLAAYDYTLPINSDLRELARTQTP